MGAAAEACREVPTRTLDEALAEVRPTRVDVVKLDIEMHECEALAGGASLAAAALSACCTASCAASCAALGLALAAQW